MFDHTRRPATAVRIRITRLGGLGLLLVMAGCERTNEVSGPADVAGPGPLTSAAQSAAARSSAQTTGGGTTTFGADLDGNGAINLSHFGFAAIIANDGSAHGHFMCLMAGNAEILGLKLMAVQGPVTFGSADGTHFGGTATVKVFHAFGNGRESIFEDVPYSVVVAPGGVGVGTLQLTVSGVFDAVAGDVVLGNGDYDLAKETLRSGRITIH
jgi:hypothetical protein